MIGALMWTSGFVAAGRYQLNERLGEGGMGEVWSAVNRITQRPVALKRLIVPRNEELRGEARARFMLEAQSTCAVDHPNVVQVLDFVEEPDGAPLIVMELLQGETLAKRLERETQLSETTTAELLLPVVSAVGSAHALGIVHRDLKPSNIFLSTERGGKVSVKVLDFGIAKWLAPEQRETRFLTQTGSTLGTPSYMAPEQATAERGVDHRADIWSLGVILYECLTGVRPVEGENAAQMVMRLLSSGIIPIQHLVPGLSPALSATIGRMLAREPRSRLEDLQEIFHVLQTFAHVRAPAFGKPHAGAVHDELSAGAAASSTAAPARPPTAEAESPRVRRSDARAPGPRASRGVVLTLAGVLILALVAVVLVRAATRGAAGPEMERTVATVNPPEPQRAEPAVVVPETNAPPEPSPAASLEPPRSTSARSKRSARPAREALAPAQTPSAPASASGKLLPPGASCDRSRECQSLLCVAFVCK